jgi:beta-N-acetylhexosaminidase
VLTDEVHRVRPVTALTVLALTAIGSYLAFDRIAHDEPRPAATIVRAPTPAAAKDDGGNDVEWREDGVYIKGRRTLDSRREPDPSAAAAPAGTSDPAPATPRRGGGLATAIGQKIVTRMNGTSPSPALLRRVRSGQVAGVILFGDNIRSLGQVQTAVARLQDAAAAGGRPPLLVAIDQEGGTVKRFASLPPTASAAQMGAGGTAAAQGASTGAALADVGVNVDLAPVADVPATAQSFLGTRAFGRDATAVARSACAFATGLKGAGVVPTLKHFPGLGAAGANTDFANVAISAPASVVRAGYAPYRRCAAQGLVMISNAAYPNVTGADPAVLSRATYRTELAAVGFRGVTISDDLQAAAVDPIPGVAVKATAAGLDLLLYAKTEQASAAAYSQLTEAVADGRLSADRIQASAKRIRALKTTLTG